MLNKSFVGFIASIAALGGILFGYDTGVISGAILFIANQFHLSPLMNGFVVSAVLDGALVGAMASGRLADYFGRRNLLIATAIIFIIGTIGSALAATVARLIMGRFVIGLAIGVASYTVPLYISEIASVEHRGALVSLNQLAITIGIVLSYIVDYFFAQNGNWRLMLACGVIPAIALFVGMLFMPYSPRWMVLKGFSDKARVVLTKLRPSDKVEQELADIQQNMAQQQKGSWRMLLQPWLRPALFIGFGLGFFQQVTGINTIIYYAPSIFKMAGFNNNVVAILATLGVGVVNVLFTVIALPLIDRWGRRPLLLFGITVMTVSLIGLSTVFEISATNSALLPWIALASMVFFIMGFAVSLGPIMWLIIAEIFPLKIRGLGSSNAVAGSWAFNMIVALTFITLIGILKPAGTFLLYGLLSVAAWLFVFYFVPETKNVSLERIEANLRAGKLSRELGTVTT